MDYFKKIGEYDNTIIVFTADNGGETQMAEDLNLSPEITLAAHKIYQPLNQSEGNLGNWDSFVSYGPGWAQVSILRSMASKDRY